jgi:flagellar protein FlgJ
MIKGIYEGSNLYTPHKDDKDDQLRKSCGEFESLFLTYILKSMKGAVPDLDEDHGGEIIKSMFDENLSQEIAKGGGIGIGALLFEQLKEKVTE